MSRGDGSGSFNRLSYDTCSYTHSLRESVGPGDYMLHMPQQECRQCFPTNPYVRSSLKYGLSYGAAAGGGGGAPDAPSWVDVSSDLLNLSRPASKCPSKKYLPGDEQSVKPLPLNLLASGDADCRFLHTEDTRLSNPPCTLRGTGVNRWQWLCHDEQQHALEPFDHRTLGVNTDLLFKDNHRPCIPKPLDPNEGLPRCPPPGKSEPVPPKFSYGPFDNIPSVTWKKCTELAML